MKCLCKQTIFEPLLHSNDRCLQVCLDKAFCSFAKRIRRRRNRIKPANKCTESTQARVVDSRH